MPRTNTNQYPFLDNAKDEGLFLIHTPDIRQLFLYPSENPISRIASTVISGHVYEGSVIKSLNDMYIMGTYSRSIGVVNAELYRKSAGIGNWKNRELIAQSFPDHLGQYLKGFGQNLGRAIYVTASDRGGPGVPRGPTGKVFKLFAAN